MNAKELADRLNGRQYRDEIEREEENLARDNNLVIVFGASDDLCEFRGAFEDEIDCYNGGDVLFWRNPDAGFEIFQECEDDCIYSRIIREKTWEIEAIWGQNGYSWTYETEIPHEKFDIMEDGEKYCRGIVFSLNDLPPLQ